MRRWLSRGNWRPSSRGSSWGERAGGIWRDRPLAGQCLKTLELLAGSYNQRTLDRLAPEDIMQLQTRTVTPEEYLELEERADYKSEYRDGEIIPMTGGTTNHNEIALNLAAYLKFQLKRLGFKIYMGDVRLWISKHRLYTYPDVMVIQGEPIYSSTSKTTVTNPSLIAEVLSKSTQNYDQGDKFTYYRSIPELQEYLLVDQSKFRTMHHVKTEQGWLLTEYEGETAVVKLKTSGLEISLKDLYEGVNFDDREEQSEQE
jgi:Uma2 family endonuclease